MVTAFRSDGRRLATTSPNGDLKLWDTTVPGQPALLMRLTDRHRIVAAAWNPTAADLLATLSTDASVTIWRMVDDRPPLEVLNRPLPLGRTGRLAWLPDGRHLGCASDDGAIHSLDVESGRRRTERDPDAAACVSFAAGTDDMFRGVYRDGTVRLMGPREDPGPPRRGRIPPVSAAAWSACGSRLAVSLPDGTVELRDESLSRHWSREGAAGAAPMLTWHGDAGIVLADPAARRLTALDVYGRTLWDAPLATAPTALAAANGIVAVGGCWFRPQLFDVRTGTPLSGDVPSADGAHRLADRHRSAST